MFMNCFICFYLWFDFRIAIISWRHAHCSINFNILTNVILIVLSISRLSCWNNIFMWSWNRISSIIVRNGNGISFSASFTKLGNHIPVGLHRNIKIRCWLYRLIIIRKSRNIWMVPTINVDCIFSLSWVVSVLKIVYVLRVIKNILMIFFI